MPLTIARPTRHDPKSRHPKRSNKKKEEAPWPRTETVTYIPIIMGAAGLGCFVPKERDEHKPEPPPREEEEEAPSYPWHLPSHIHSNDFFDALQRHPGTTMDDDDQGVIAHLIQQYPDLARLPWYKEPQSFALHAAILGHAPSVVIQALARAYPEAAQQPDRGGLIPLRAALMMMRNNNTAPETVYAIFEAWPDGICDRDRHGNTMLHDAVRTRLPILQFVLDKWPEAIRATNHHSCLPLHVAAGRASREVVQFLVEHDPTSVRHQDADSSLPLHAAAQRDGPDDHDPDAFGVVQCLVGTWPGAVGFRDRLGFLPLHRAVMGAQTSLDVVRYLVKVRPESHHDKDNLGRTPVHVAFHSGHGWTPEDGPMRVKRFLLERSPSTVVREKDCRGSLPIHLAVDQSGRLALGPVALLVSQWSGALRERDGNGRLPLHIVAAQCRSEWGHGNPRQLDPETRQVIQFLLEQCPQASLETDHRGCTPLQLALDRKEINVDLVRVLVAHGPQALQQRNPLGRLPVHTALERTDLPPFSGIVPILIENGPHSVREVDAAGSLPLHIAVRRWPYVSTDVIRSLVECYPPSVLHKDRRGGSTALHLWMWVEPTYSVPYVPLESMVRFFVGACPAVLHATDANGFVPLHAAAAAGAPLDVLFFLASAWPGFACRDDGEDRDVEPMLIA